MKLTPTELLVLRDLAQNGGTYRDVAQRLCMGHQTVKNHLSDAYSTLGVGNRVDAFRALGWLTVR